MALTWLAVGSVPAGAAPQAAPTLDFNREVRPILARHCFKCHGPDDKARKARLRLDRREEAVKPAGSGASPIVTGRPEESELVSRIFAEDEGRFSLTPLAECLLDPSMKALATVRGEFQYRAWGQLLSSVQSGGCTGRSSWCPRYRSRSPGLR